MPRVGRPGTADSATPARRIERRAGSRTSLAARAGDAMDRSFQSERDRMVEHQLIGRGIRDAHVLRAMRTVPRERFVDDRLAPFAYEDGPLPIAAEQTISQPYMVAWMVE